MSEIKSKLKSAAKWANDHSFEIIYGGTIAAFLGITSYITYASIKAGNAEYEALIAAEEAREADRIAAREWAIEKTEAGKFVVFNANNELMAFDSAPEIYH